VLSGDPDADEDTQPCTPLKLAKLPKLEALLAAKGAALHAREGEGKARAGLSERNRRLNAASVVGAMMKMAQMKMLPATATMELVAALMATPGGMELILKGGGSGGSSDVDEGGCAAGGMSMPGWMTNGTDDEDEQENDKGGVGAKPDQQALQKRERVSKKA
jgi:hypothetical protein